MDIKVLGPGCTKCEKTATIIKEVLEETGTEATFEKVADLLKIAGYGVFGTPAVVIDGDVKSVGKIPTKEKIRSWLDK